MDVKRFLVTLAVAGCLSGPLAACGDNTNVERGETNCDSAEQASNPQDASCEQTGENEGNSNP